MNKELSNMMGLFISKLYAIKQCIKDDAVIIRWDIVALYNTRERIKGYFNDYKQYSSSHSLKCSAYHDLWIGKSIYQYWEDAIKDNTLETISLDDIMDDKFFNEILDELHDICDDKVYDGYTING